MTGVPVILGLIPARGGSKRLPGKNLTPLAGRPLIAWTIRAARDSVSLDRVVVSTDDPEIAEIAKRQGAETPFLRPARLALDDTSSEAVAVHALETLELERGYLVLLQPTSPLRAGADIDAAVRRCRDAEWDALVSVRAPEKPGHWMLRVDDGDNVSPLFPDAFFGKEAAPNLVLPNGAIFIARIETFLREPTFWPRRTGAFIMPGERSLDIDKSEDLMAAERYLERKTRGWPR